MDRELRTETAASESTSGHKPKVFVIVGTPDMGKMDLAMDVINLVDDLTFVDVPESPHYSLGSLADYRAELFNALQRYFVQMEHYKNGEDQIVTHSLIDSFAWAIYNTQRRIANNTFDEEGAEAVNAIFIGQILLDSLAADHIFLVEGWSDDDNMILFERMAAIARNLNVPITVLYEEDKDKWPEICAKIVKEIRG